MKMVSKNDATIVTLALYSKLLCIFSSFFISIIYSLKYIFRWDKLYFQMEVKPTKFYEFMELHFKKYQLYLRKKYHIYQYVFNKQPSLNIETFYVCKCLYFLMFFLLQLILSNWNSINKDGLEKATRNHYQLVWTSMKMFKDIASILLTTTMNQGYAWRTELFRNSQLVEIRRREVWIHFILKIIYNFQLYWNSFRNIGLSMF